MKKFNPDTVHHDFDGNDHLSSLKGRGKREESWLPHLRYPPRNI